jgi:AraC-like DNA-binding protein
MNLFDRSIELSSGLETDYVRVIYYDLPESYRDNYRSYEYYRICTILDGEKHVAINDENFNYNREEFIILPPESVVEMEIVKDTRALVFELSDKLIDDIVKKTQFEPEIEAELYTGRIKLCRENSEIILRDIELISETAKGNRKGKEFLIDLYVQEMTYKILNIAGANLALNHAKENPIAQSIDIMKKNIRENLSLHEIAHAVFMSPQLFSIKFKKLTGVSPNCYYTSLKLNEARKMLKESSVTEVAFDLGYDNISHFIRLFSEKFGMTPKRYQLHHYPKMLIS